jgi:hypothetical protein
MLASTFTSSTFTLQAAGASSNVTASIAVSGATATLTPSSGLAAGTTYTATVAGTVTDTNGIALGTTATWTFTTASAATPPVILSQSPAAGATGVSTGTTVSVTFSHTMLASTFTSSTFTLQAAGASSNVAASIAVSGATATLTPSSALAAGTTYTATVAGTVTDTNGIALGTTATWTFTTQSSAGTNLLVSPNDITNPAWQVYGSGCSVTNANTLTYGASSCTLYQVVNVSANTTYTASVTVTLASGKGDYVTNGLFTTSFGSLCTSSAAVISSTPSVKACTVSSGANTKVQIEIDTGGTAAGSMTISGATIHQ